MPVTRDGPTVTASESLAVRHGASDLTRRPLALALAAWQFQRATGKFKLPTESGAAGPGRTLELPLSADWINLNLKIASVDRFTQAAERRLQRPVPSARMCPSFTSDCHREKPTVTVTLPVLH